MKISIHKESSIDLTHRVEMLGSMFEVPISDKLSVSLEGDIDLESKPWSVGLIVGPSGSGKTITMKELFGYPKQLEWKAKSVIDDFPDSIPIESVARVCQSVGFNTVPAWLRPFSVLSNGERFRAEIARTLLCNSGTILIDEFSSVVDRQVAQITSFAVQKYVRENNLRFVAASCHYDIIEWLDPDWILEPGNPIRLTWRSLRRSRPPINVSISRVKYETWNLFREYHYMSQDLNKAARCYGLFIEDRIACMCGILHFPHPKVNDLLRFTRMVTLPDFQGLGLAMCLAGTIASAYKAMGKRLHSYPNHPAWLRSYQRSKDWIQVKNSGDFSPKRGETSTVGGFGGKRCAVFLYIGSAMNLSDAEQLIKGE